MRRGLHLREARRIRRWLHSPDVLATSVQVSPVWANKTPRQILDDLFAIAAMGPFPMGRPEYAIEVRERPEQQGLTRYPLNVVFREAP